jgi:DNA topoisomerase IB
LFGIDLSCLARRDRAFPGALIEKPLFRRPGLRVAEPVVRLRHVDPSSPGWSRRRRGRGFEYLDVAADRITDAETLERIRALAIPPAWKNVWICPWPNGHLQATGTDAAGRLQYLYHPEWRASRDREKFERMLVFAASLPALRTRVADDLGSRGLRRERVLACATRLLDRGFFRIGCEEYVEENGTFGLATLRKRHVRLPRDGSIVFSYVAKGRKPRTLRLVDDDVRPVLRSLKARPGGRELFTYRNGVGFVPIRSNDVNAYVREATDGPFSAKDFRTWHATVLAAASVAVLGRRVRTRAARERVAVRASREVARYLGNTPAVCRESYIDPRVFERFYEGRTIELDLDALAERFTGADCDLGAAEAAVVRLLTR